MPQGHQQYDGPDAFPEAVTLRQSKKEAEDHKANLCGESVFYSPALFLWCHNAYSPFISIEDTVTQNLCLRVSVVSIAQIEELVKYH